MCLNSRLLLVFHFLHSVFFLLTATGADKNDLPKVSRGEAQLVTLPQVAYAGTLGPITVTGEWHYPTPVVLLHLGLKNWISAEQDELYRGR